MLLFWRVTLNPERLGGSKFTEKLKVKYSFQVLSDFVSFMDSNASKMYNT